MEQQVLSEHWRDGVAVGRASSLSGFTIIGAGWGCTAPDGVVCNVEILLDSPLLLKEQDAVMTRRIFAQLHIMHPLCLWIERSFFLSLMP